MGFFDFLKRKPEPAVEPSERPSLIIALDHWQAPDTEGATKALEPLTAQKVAISLDAGADDNVLAGVVRFGGHEVRVVGFDVAVPKPVMEKTVECSAWKGEPLGRLQNHKAHLILFHDNGGKDTADRLTALFQIGAALGGANFAGVIHESAWTCSSHELAKEFLSFDGAKEMRESLPPIIYFGVLPFTEGKDSWVATKGGHLFGVPDLMLERQGEANTDLFGLLHNIFVYMTQGTRISAGHTMQTGEEQFFRFEELSPDHKYYDWLKGAAVTLELVRITKEEVKQRG